VTVIDGTFVGAAGRVVSPDEAKALRDRNGGERSLYRFPPGMVWVALPIFGRTMPVLLQPFQIERRRSGTA
jgi:transcription antitermination factor NusG